MRRVAFALVVALIGGQALAQDGTERRVAAESYMRSPVQQAMIDQMLSADQMLGLLRSQAPAASAPTIESFARIAGEELAKLRDVVEEAMVETAVETLTLAEIEALDAFYRTPEGVSVMQKMPAFMQGAMTRIGPDLQTTQARIMERFMAEQPKN